MVVIAIWSLSLAVDLPGLAVTPIEGSLRSIFPDATDFKIQLLTVLPNVVIIPFVLLSGKLSETRHRLAVITAGIVMYVAAGLLSMLSGSLTVLILLSCLLGAGCGLILPFSTGLIAAVFVGKYRTRQMGIISGIGNVALVTATFVAGFLAARSWHLPFLVYTIPLVSLFLLPWLRRIPRLDDSGVSDSTAAGTPQNGAESIPPVDAMGFATKGQKVRGGFYLGRTVWLLLAYAVFEFVGTVPAYYLPDLMPLHGLGTEDVSTVISVFYLGMFLIGVSVTYVMKAFRGATFVMATAMIAVGMVLYTVSCSMGLYILAAALSGMGNGIAQPLFYTKATQLVIRPGRETMALAYLLSANYVGISIAPVIIQLFEAVCGVRTARFPFEATTVVSLVILLAVILRCRHFVFGIHKGYYD